ncbi:Oligopeptide-dipeptide ABC transporter ATPase subunit protein [Halorhabdus tiamatea SARL4B]|uniref:Oligopeptide-dipeptide ABC transporter ATPase subunit protein n=1 Tax=Halorhabdus tiamatea SARL4B TaxID=1033806 RepID=U2E0R3_9EURY|nr:ABC transporter ATP-binding protein [Halorhabdus tiamatea]ERJ05606.1 Oligopeptide-dipeptide ABC transporter ATPase subunit protein [Halorhabdus tiamatea SARL4B]
MQAQSSKKFGVSDPIFEVRNASITFDMDRGESKVMDSVDMDIERGEILGVVGESGSGKSMFASALLDAVPEPGVLLGDITFHPESGEEIDLLDQSEREIKQIRWEQIAMVFQGAMSSFNPTMTIGAHFRETLSVHGFDVEEGMERAEDLLSQLYLEADQIFDSYPHELSGGMQQRSLLALSLVLEPEALVMDEPTAALDLLMQRSIIELIREIGRERDLTIVFITHDLPLVANLADRLGVLYAFEFVEVGPAYEVLTGSKHPYTRALLNSTPNLDTPREEMKPIEGKSPDPVNVPKGCSYHPRCPLADETCVQVDPEFSTGNGDDDHQAKCHYIDQTRAEIPLNLTEVTHNE